MAIRPKRAEHGVIFAILPHYRRGDVILGLEIRSASFSEGTTVSLIHASNGKTKTVFDFTVSDTTGKWTRLAFSIRKDGVTFYHDCKEMETKFGPLGDLTLPSYSALYIGRAGWTPGAQSSTFEVSPIDNSYVLSNTLHYISLFHKIGSLHRGECIISVCLKCSSCSTSFTLLYLKATIVSVY